MDLHCARFQSVASHAPPLPSAYSSNRLTAYKPAPHRGKSLHLGDLRRRLRFDPQSRTDAGSRTETRAPTGGACNGKRSYRRNRSGGLAILASLRRTFDCQKLSLRPRRGNADATYRGGFFSECYWTCVMWDKRANKSAAKPPRSPHCFGCARPMQLVRRTPRFGGLRDLYTFECRACGVWHIEEGDDAVEDRPAGLGAVLAA